MRAVAVPILIALTFFRAGSAAADDPPTFRPGSLTMQRDGKIVVAAHQWSGATPGGSYIVEVVRLTKGGKIDGTFGNSGRVFLLVPERPADARVVTDRKKRVVVGIPLVSGRYEVHRLLPDGRADPDFSFDGVVTSNSLDGSLRDVGVTADGSVLIVGDKNNTAENARDIVVRRLTPGGTDDPNFGVLGTHTFTSGLDDTASGVAADKFGQTWIAGAIRESSGGSDSVLIRLDVNGLLDNRFGFAGSAVTDAGEFEWFSSIGFGKRGLALAMGTAANGANWALAQFDAFGNPDPNFGTAGVVTPSAEGSKVQDPAFAAGPSGRIVVAGYSGRSGVVVRLNSKGSLDFSFAPSKVGQLALKFPNLDASTTEQFYWRDVVVDRSGNMVLLGTLLNSQTNAGPVVIGRVTKKGRVDTRNGAAGLAILIP